jgi:putative transposase
VKTVSDTLEVSRSRQHERKKKGGSSRKRHYKKADDDRYLSLVRQITDERASYGYRRVTAMINRQLGRNGQFRVSPKRIYRLMKMNHLLLQRYTGRPARLHEGSVIMKRSNLPLVF